MEHQAQAEFLFYLLDFDYFCLDYFGYLYFRIFEETFQPPGQSINSIKQLVNIRVPTDDESQIIDKVFNNKFTYKIPDGERILAERLFIVPCWSDECLQSLKRVLNEAKSEQG